jgi:PKD repeat protein
VQGAPDLSASTNVINFGSITQFTTSRDSFIIDNLGCDSLRITNVLSSNSDFSVSTNQAVIAPRTSLTFYVDFNPTVIGSYSDSIRIINNDADEVIYFNGNSSGAPALVVSPKTYADTTYNCVDSIIVPIKVKNPGGSTLNANFGNVANSSLDSMLSNLLRNHTNITSQIPNLYLFRDGLTGNSISDGGGDMYDGGNFLNTNLQTAIPYTNNAVLNSTAFGLSGEDYFTCKTPGLFVMVADLDNVSQFRITGNLGADGSGQVAANVINMTHNGVPYVGFTKSVHAAGDPSINHLIIVEQSVGATRTHLTTTGLEDHRINNLSSANRIYYLLYSNGYSSVPLSSTVNQSIMTAFLDEIGKGGDFEVSFTPSSASVPAGDSVTVNAKIVIRNQATGWYDASSFVTSNDPLLPLDSINFDIYVSASPQINFAASCLNFGSQFINTTTTDSLLTWNTGCDTLNISAVVPLSGNFSTNQSNLRLAPGDSVYLRVTYNPTTIGNHNSFIRVFNNDVDSTICLNAISTPAPIASVTPSTLTATVNFCDTIDQTLNISNLGGGLLRYSFGSTANSSGNLEVLATTLGADMGTEYPNTIAAINSSFTNYNLTTFNTVNSFGSLDSNLFKQQLVGKDVVLIPELENSAPAYSTIYPALRRFVNNGGTVLFFGSGGSNANVIFNSGLFNGSFLNNQNSGTVTVDQPSHPLLDSTTLPFFAASATFYYNILNPDTSLVMSISGNPVIVTRNQGLGKVALIGFDYFATNSDITRVAGNAMRWAGSSGRLAPWIRIDRSEDSLSASNSHAVRVTFDASNLSAGLHTSDITIFTNDPLNPTITIPCSLTVLNTPCADFTFTKANNCTRTVSFSDNSSNGPNLFSWDFGDGNTSSMRNPSHTYQTAGTYTVTFIASNATSSDTAIRTVNITSMTAAFTAAGQRVVGQPINFSSSAVGATSYFWNFGNGQFSSAATPSMIYTNAGQYVVSLAVVNSQGCSAVSSDTLNILITGLDEKSVSESIQLYPNPSNGIFNLRYSGQMDLNTLKLNDAEGRLIRTLSISEKTKEFNVSDLAPGVYHLQIQIEGYAPINKPLIIK